MKNIYLLLMMLSLFSCGEGYQKQNGQWAWVYYGDSFRKRVVWIYPVDKKSFKVLSNKYYAKDKDRVFYAGREIKDADSGTFKVLDKHGYAKDKNSVFLDVEKIVFANPASFEVLEFPYTKDKNHVFCGTLPLFLDKNEIDEFKVINTDKMMSGTKTTTLTSYFIEYNPEYKWLDTLDIKWVIVGTQGTGETSRKKFKGIKQSMK